MINFIGYPDSFTRDLRPLLSGSRPFFLSRIGGSDTDAVIDFLVAESTNSSEALEGHVRKHLPIVSTYNGFYAKRDIERHYFDYLRRLIACYKSLTIATVCNAKLVTAYFPTCIHPSLQEFSESPTSVANFFSNISQPWRPVNLYPYNRIENIGTHHTLMNLLAETLVGKKVLVVSPFAKSVTENFGRRHTFFKEINYPEFELRTVNTPITYFGLSDEFYPHENWVQTLEALQQEISKQDFDVALLSCGSYALPLGGFISATLQKQAIYVGGVLQLMFGIMGRRYENIFFSQHINTESFIYPIEKDRYLGDKTIAESAPKEAFGAYF